MIKGTNIKEEWTEACCDRKLQGRACALPSIDEYTDDLYILINCI